MTLKDLQSRTDDWIKTYGVRYFNELTNMALLTEEVGELARVIARKFGEQSSKANDLDKSLEEEIGDVLFVLTCIANQTGIDLDKAIEKTLAKKTERDSERHKQNRKLF